MQQNDFQQLIRNCPDLAVLDDAAREFLSSRCEKIHLQPGIILYSEGAMLDNTFCLLLLGDLLVEAHGSSFGHIQENQLFGEMAYFTHQKTRTATVRAGSSAVLILKFQLTQAELSAAPFMTLKQNLGAQAWGRFVGDSQRKI
jgi:CRP-like cAMP-binding protein